MSDVPEHPLVEPLSDRELDVMALLAEGKTNQEIALDLSLSINTIKWYARQIYGKLGVDNREEAARRALALGLLPQRGKDALPEHNLPAQLTPFVGRREELAALEELLNDSATRLISVVGPGGIGKTRLALQAARQQLHHNPRAVADGVFFVSLANVDDVRDILELLAQTMGLAPLQSDANIAERLQRYLHKRRLLLLVDEAEHLVGDELSTLLDDLLRGAAEFKLLATSRTRLGVRGEHLFWVEGLSLGAAGATTTSPDPAHLPETSSAVALFLQTARRSCPEFTLTGENAPKVLKVCRLVEGMPLGIELAAVWMGLLTLDELLEELSRSPDILTTEAGNVPPGQRSLRAVFDTSWTLLEPAERQALRCLSVFRGGFTREAATAVCDVVLPDLLSLINKCWFKRDEAGRFSMHELLRQYAAEALAAQPDQHAQSRKRHSATICRWLASQKEAIHGPQHEDGLAAVEREMGNVRAACLAALETDQLEPLYEATYTLVQFYRWRGSYRAGERFFGALLHKLEDGPATTPRLQRLRARLLVCQARLLGFLGQGRRSRDLLSEAETLVQLLEESGREMSLERQYLAQQRGYESLLRRRNPQEALDYFSEAHRRAQNSGSPWEEAQGLLALARARRNLRQYREAEVATAKGIALLRQGGNAAALAEALFLQANILTRMERFQEAEALLEEEAVSSHAGIEAYRLVNLGYVRFLLGEFEPAEACLARGIANYRENEIASGMPWMLTLARTRLHLGHYSAAPQVAAGAASLFPSSRIPEARAMEAYLRGAAALAEGQYEAAGEALRRSLAAWKPTPDLHRTVANACLALSERSLGHDEKASQFLGAELRLALTSRAFVALLISLSTAALLLADYGDVPRAAEIYFRVWQEPFAHNSVWLRDVAGRELEGITTRLTEEERAAARERAEGLDLWEMAEALLEELG